ncbi:hypothetical protein [Novosphingobium barchaimii]|uniref:hypothetical protein n=1 Tax=Novosphingobium barchaimii TaxID=1420591 RepID=UPI001F17F4D5|nr:hypothetical protein [Novosphingobium barchaimii]
MVKIETLERQRRIDPDEQEQRLKLGDIPEPVKAAKPPSAEASLQKEIRPLQWSQGPFHYCVSGQSGDACTSGHAVDFT